jgi:hypothetical protein
VGSFGNFTALCLQALEFFDGAGVKTFGLGVGVEEILPGAGTADEPLEADSETESAILVEGNLESAPEAKEGMPCCRG